MVIFPISCYSSPNGLQPQNGVSAVLEEQLPIRFQTAKDPEHRKKFEQLVGEVAAFELTRKVSSLLDIIKDMNQVLNNGDPSFYRIADLGSAVPI
ncbi:MAG: hypothetical protein CSB33_00300 [Desulfobacterales bacterium]|nr:MAG: hypothetical protein CSB33_00300 [Desulfobacterales bacterium]